MPLSFKTTFVLVLICCLAAHGQSKDVLLKNIRSVVEKTNSDRSLKTIEIDDFTGETTDGGSSLTAYEKNGFIFKMVAWIGLSYCVKQYDYYLTENNKPIFIYETEKDFPPNKDGSLDYTKLKTVFEGRYYINNGALLNVKLKGKKLMDKKPDEAAINHLIADVKGYIKLTSARLKK